MALVAAGETRFLLGLPLPPSGVVWMPEPLVFFYIMNHAFILNSENDSEAF